MPKAARLTSYDDLMIEHTAHVEVEHGVRLCGLSPMLHIRVVPCHLRRSFPACIPFLTKLDLVSTDALKGAENERLPSTAV